MIVLLESLQLFYWAMSHPNLLPHHHLTTLAPILGTTCLRTVLTLGLRFCRCGAQKGASRTLMWKDGTQGAKGRSRTGSTISSIETTLNVSKVCAGEILGNEGEQKKKTAQIDHKSLHLKWWMRRVKYHHRFFYSRPPGLLFLWSLLGSKMSLALGMEAVLPHKYFHLSEGTSGMSFWEGLISDNIDPFGPFFNDQNPSC